MKRVEKFYDTNGNYIQIVSSEGAKKVILYLLNSRSRNIGSIKDGIYTITRMKRTHLFRKFNAYGFNSWMLHNVEIDTIVLREFDGVNMLRVYHIPVDVVKEKGKYLSFKDRGFETQVFLPLSIIEDYEQFNEAI